MPGLGAPLSERIMGTEQQIDETAAREGVLTSELTGLDNQLTSLNGEISALLDKESALLEQIETKRVELEDTRADVAATEERLEQVEQRLAKAEALLADRLIEIYKTDEPDLVTVVLEADGFADLLERTEYLERISDQDRRIVDRVRELRAEVEGRLERLETLEQQIEDALAQIIADRNELAAARAELTVKRDEVAGVRSDRQAALAQVRQTRVDLEGNLASLEEEQERIEAELAAAREEVETPAPTAAAPVQEGSGGLVYPVDGAITSPFGMRWGRLHAGIDIAAPSGVPVRAAAAGTVVTAAPTSGYGNYVCIQHSSGGLSTCYAHLSSYAVSAGSSVGQGEVIGAVGCTGSCFGDHLHFETRVNGSPVDPMGYL